MKFSHLTRLYTNQSICENQLLKIQDEKFHYLKSVMRLKKADIFRLFNSVDGEFIAKIEEIGKSFASVKIESKIRSVTKQKDLALGLCIIKPDRMIEAIKMATQLGVTKIIPLQSARTQYQKTNQEKVEKCILQATEQSERFEPAQLLPEMKLEEFCRLTEFEQVIFACESEAISKKISDIKKLGQKLAVLIGPEGGFSEQEISFIKSYNHIYSVSLGNTVLRAETAAAAALSCVQLMRSYG